MAGPSKERSAPAPLRSHSASSGCGSGSPAFSIAIRWQQGPNTSAGHFASGIDGHDHKGSNLRPAGPHGRQREPRPDQHGHRIGEVGRTQRRRWRFAAEPHNPFGGGLIEGELSINIRCALCICAVFTPCGTASAGWLLMIAPKYGILRHYTAP